ncbi:RNA-directed DNA polymerase (Reverse transcriptase), Ribonuclease H-like protein [Gossypium australe]|uniref:RNA-directed DNA polymerase (Reverse transcriptase), Ribonuclease H-like protein n=1 Tax=Gossypium australe TaxID=47621 RepID=A0A5B6VY08_9ROSI|nr:RNA-directed DNA polymerase (Reverse transcriptase), Ribonuclease H-like protein [Gossypium australe]
MMHKEIEVYVDDMITKSQMEKEHVQVLRKLFLRLRKFQLKLNPAKYTFRARSGKLLGFLASEKGIEIEPDKVRAIQELPSPRRLNYIAHFISQLTEKCNPIFCLLKKYNWGVWDEECQKNFDKYLEISWDAYWANMMSQEEKKERYTISVRNSLNIFANREVVLCLDLDNLKTETVHVVPHNLAHIKTGPSKVQDGIDCFEWKNGPMANSTFRVYIVYVNQKAVKGSAIADFLASRALEKFEPLNFDFPNEDLMYVATTEEDF